MDILLDSIKAFGRSQIIYLLIFGLLMITSALNFYASVFFAAEPLLVCREGDFIFTNITEAETCFLWQQYLANRIDNISSALVCQFETNVYKLTIVSDYELVCDRKYLISLSQSFFFFGCLSGFFNGFLSDKYGRRKSTLIFIVLLLVFSFIFHILILDSVQFLEKYEKFYVYCIYQFVRGILMFCIYQVVYILACELTLEKYHTLFTNIMISFYVIGEIVIMVAFYFMRNWRDVGLFITLFFAVSSLIFWIVIPESPKWLYETNSYDKCLEILKKISKINGRKLEYNPSELALLKQKSVIDNPLKDLDESILRKIFLNKYNVLYIIGLFLVWNSINLQYTTTSLGIISSLEINPYLMFVLNACFELVGAWFSMMGDWIGRKKAFNLSILTIGVGSIVMTFIPEDDTNIDKAKYYLILKATVSLLSRFMQSASYNLSIIYSVNLFDIKIRSTVLLFLGCAGSISTLIAPQINMLKSTWKHLPYYVNAATSFGSGLIIFFMPEGYKKSQAIDMD